MREARKLFRLFKSIIEYQKLIAILLDDRDDWLKVFRVLGQVCFFFYWFFDNISIACKINIIRGNHLRNNTVAACFWLASLLISIPVLLIESRHTKDPIERHRQLLDAAKYTFDLLPAGKESAVVHKIMGWQISPELQAVGGLTSGLISTVQVIQESSRA